MRLLLLLLGACGADERPGRPHVDPTPTAPTGLVQRLSPEAQAIRASMALRGQRPAPDELARVRAGGEAELDVLVDAWIDSDAFGQTIRAMHAEQFLLEDDWSAADALPQVGPLVGWDQATIDASRQDEPLRLVERVVREGMPYAEIVTADWMMTDAVLAAAYGTAHDPDGPTWQVSRWVDGRPHAGILSSTQVWRRHFSNTNNLHRARANNIVSRVLLCDEIGARDIDLEQSDLPITSDIEAVADALYTEPACVACHQALDPIASTFWGFKRDIFAGEITSAYEEGCAHVPTGSPGEEGAEYLDDFCYPLVMYRPENESLWQEFGQRPPGYYGQPVRDLAELGAHIAADDRFLTCSVRRFVSWFTQHEVDEVPASLVDDLRDDWVAAELDARALVRAIVRSDALMAAETSDGAWVAGVQSARPYAVGNQIAAVTGFRYLSEPGDPERCGSRCVGTVDLVLSSKWGYRTLLGGTDGQYQPHPTHGPTPARALALQRLSAEAAAWVVSHDLAEADPARRRLLTLLPPDPDDDDVRAQLEALQQRVLGASDPRVVPLLEGLYARGADPDEGWRLVVAALLQDPAFVSY